MQHWYRYMLSLGSLPFKKVGRHDLPEPALDGKPFYETTKWYKNKQILGITVLRGLFAAT